MHRVLVLGLTIAALVVPDSALAWAWPTDGRVVKPFQLGDDPYAAGQHRGIDIEAVAGEAVLAPASGVISYAGTVPQRGRTITIATPDGFSVTLSHLGEIQVRKGDTVAEGGQVGLAASSGAPERQEPFVQLGIRDTSDPNGYRDPLAFLPARVGAPAPPAATPATGPATAPVASPTPTPPAQAPSPPPAPAGPSAAPSQGPAAASPATVVTAPAPAGTAATPASTPATQAPASAWEEARSEAVETPVNASPSPASAGTRVLGPSAPRSSSPNSGSGQRPAGREATPGSPTRADLASPSARTSSTAPRPLDGVRSVPAGQGPGGSGIKPAASSVTPVEKRRSDARVTGIRALPVPEPRSDHRRSQHSGSGRKTVSTELRADLPDRADAGPAGGSPSVRAARPATLGATAVRHPSTLRVLTLAAVAFLLLTTASAVVRRGRTIDLQRHFGELRRRGRLRVFRRYGDVWSVSS